MTGDTGGSAASLAILGGAENLHLWRLLNSSLLARHSTRLSLSLSSLLGSFVAVEPPMRLCFLAGSGAPCSLLAASTRSAGSLNLSFSYSACHQRSTSFHDTMIELCNVFTMTEPSVFSNSWRERSRIQPDGSICIGRQNMLYCVLLTSLYISKCTAVGMVVRAVEGYMRV